MLRRLRTAMGFAMRLREVGGAYAGVDGAHIACGNPGGGRTDAPVLAAVSGPGCAARAISDGT